MILNTGSIKFYDGFVYHKRNGAKKHFFKNNINAIFIELKNNKYREKYKYPALFSINKFNLLAWHPSYHGAQLEKTDNQNLYKFILNLIDKSDSKKHIIDNIKLLTFPKVFGLGFNPLSVYFCYDIKGSLLHTVFEVRNTFGDIHHYILQNTKKNNKTQKTIKKLFVSPFYPQKGYYHLYANQLNDKILTSVDYIINDNKVFSASMNLKEIKFNNFNILKALVKFSLFPGKVWINIHLQAFFLWLKKIRIYKIPISQKIKHSFGMKISRD